MTEDNIIRPAAFNAIADDRRLQQHARQLAKLREIEGPAGKRGVCLVGLSDRIEAGLAVGRLVQRARGAGITVAAIRKEMRGTDRIERYMLRSGLDPVVERSASRKLLQQVSGYLAVAAVVARLMRQDPDALKIEVLAHTSLWSRSSFDNESDDPRPARLATELGEMCKAVARRTGLAALFARARNLPGRWDPVTETFAADARPPGPVASLPAELPCLNHDGYLDWIEHWLEAPPLPSVPLARVVHSLFTIVARIETVGRDAPLLDETALSNDFVGQDEAVTFELSREVRLALGPTAGLGSVGALFETRAHVRLLRLLHGPEQDAPTPAFYDLMAALSLKPVDDCTRSLPTAVFQACIDGRWHRVATLDPFDDVKAVLFDHSPEASPIDWQMDPWNPKSPPIEHWYLQWQGVTPAAVAHWFSKPDGGHQAMAFAYDGSRAKHLPAYPKGTLAHVLEQALDSGGLESALTVAVNRMAAALAAHELEWREGCEARHIDRLLQWHMSNDPVSAPSTDPLS